MKINNTNNINNVKYINNYNANNEKTKNNEKAPKGDKLEISTAGKALNNLSIINDNIDIKDMKEVERIKKQLTEGKYKVDSKALADKLVDIMKGRV